jgi:Uma2 family endonuclease
MVMTAVTLKLDPVVQLTEAAFYELCSANPDAKLERSANGELIIMSPTGGEGGNYNAEIITDFGIWNRQTAQGYLFDSSTGFRLPNGAGRSPDTAWVRKERWEALTPEQRRAFPPLAPDFVLELRSASDDLSPLQDKMRDYINNGVRLGWLINPQDQQVEIYRPCQAVETLTHPQSISGEDVLPGLVLNVSRFWS